MATWDDYFDSVINEPKSWMDSVSDLLSSATALGAQCTMLDKAFSPSTAKGDAGFRFFGPILLLRACALECAFKAMWLRQGHKLGENGRLVKIPGSHGHELVPLAAAVGFSVSDAERAVLDRLSLWNETGRYPTPLNWSKWTTQETGGLLVIRESGEKHRMRFSWSIENEDECGRLLTRVVKALQ